MGMVHDGYHGWKSQAGKEVLTGWKVAIQRLKDQQRPGDKDLLTLWLGGRTYL
jgi:hypothetical protein